MKPIIFVNETNHIIIVHSYCIYSDKEYQLVYNIKTSNVFQVLQVANADCDRLKKYCCRLSLSSVYNQNCFFDETTGKE